MKRLLFIFVVLVATNAYSQEPTRQQTIDWLTSKINNKRWVSNSLQRIYYIKLGVDDEAHQIILQDTWDDPYHVVQIPFDFIDSVQIVVSGDNSFIVIRTKGNNITFLDRYFQRTTANMYYFGFDWNEEPNLENRILKAFQDIVKENRAKKEAY